MNGIDVSGWQPPNITGMVDYDFVIIKATEGTGYVSPNCDKQYQIAKTREKCIGVYHFLRGGDPVAEANFFVDNIQGYLGEAILVLDWEANAINMGREWLRSVIKQVKKRTKSGIMIYGSLSPMQAHDIPGIAKDEGVKLWVAAYPNYNSGGYREESQLLGSVVRQYSSVGRLPGYNSNLDLNRSTLTPQQWREFAKGGYDVVLASTNVPSPLKPVDQVADAVIRGEYGNGEDRRNRLTVAGYNYSEVQAVVNMKLGAAPAPQHKTEQQIADEVIGGLWGNGDDRRNRLKEAGYNYDSIQAIVNSKMGVSAEVAKEQPQWYTVPSGAAGYNGVTAAKFGLTVDQLVQMNKSKYPNMTANYVQAGWTLRVK
jgi:lysozyme